jgi:hypothetical protein
MSIEYELSRISKRANTGTLLVTEKFNMQAVIPVRVCPISSSGKVVGNNL